MKNSFIPILIGALLLLLSILYVIMLMYPTQCL